jgi:hypothetical protein
MPETRQQRRARERSGERQEVSSLLRERIERGDEVVVGASIAFIAVGLALAMTTVSYFSFGIVIATIGIVCLLIYWYIKLQRIWSLLFILAAAIIVIIVLLKGAPLLMSAVALEGDFAQGTVVGGVEWQDNYSEVRLVMDNPQYWSYSNISIIIRANLPIAKVGSLSPLSQCSYTMDKGPFFAAELKILGDKGSTIPLLTPEAKGTMADQYKIICDKLIGHNSLELVIAIVPGLFQKQRETASWLSIMVEYEAFGRSFREPRHFCFEAPPLQCKFVDPIIVP